MERDTYIHVLLSPLYQPEGVIHMNPHDIIRSHDVSRGHMTVVPLIGSLRQIWCMNYIHSPIPYLDGSHPSLLV